MKNTVSTLNLTLFLSCLHTPLDASYAYCVRLSSRSNRNFDILVQEFVEATILCLGPQSAFHKF
jgi:hypothetical protein